MDVAACSRDLAAAKPGLYKQLKDAVDAGAQPADDGAADRLTSNMRAAARGTKEWQDAQDAEWAAREATIAAQAEEAQRAKRQARAAAEEQERVRVRLRRRGCPDWACCASEGRLLCEAVQPVLQHRSGSWADFMS